MTVGGTCEIVATVTEGGDPAADVDVTFLVVEGPHEGDGATVSTDAAGVATFSFDADSVGVDVVEVSYTDSLSRLQTDTSTCTVVAAGTEAPAPTPVGALPNFTG